MTSWTLVTPVRAAWPLALAGALLLSACAGGADGSGSESATGDPEHAAAATDSAAPEASAPAASAPEASAPEASAPEASAPEASAPEASAPEASALEAIEPRSDGLTGAPVPRLEVQSAEFDASRLNQTAGRFPSLDDPAVVSASEAPWLEAETLVLGAVQNGEARAYPIAMMTFHHVANDVLGGEPYLVTF